MGNKKKPFRLRPRAKKKKSRRRTQGNKPGEISAETPEGLKEKDRMDAYMERNFFPAYVYADEAYLLSNVCSRGKETSGNEKSAGDSVAADLNSGENKECYVNKEPGNSVAADLNSGEKKECNVNKKPDIFSNLEEKFEHGSSIERTDNQSSCEQALGVIVNEEDNGSNSEQKDNCCVGENINSTENEQSLSKTKRKKKRKKNSDNNDVTLTGRRLVDMGHLFSQIMKQRHGGGLDCSFMDMELKKECKIGLHTKWVFKCKMCHTEATINSENESPDKINVNQAAVNGAVAAGFGYTQISEWAAAVELPFMAAGTFNSTMNNVGAKIHEVAWSSMYQAAMEEIRHAIEIGNVDIDGIPMCIVICDGQWSKRSYKTKYDALSGSAAIIGFYTKKILFIGVRNKYCIICDKAKSTNKPVPEHLCFLNWNKPSTGMEADIIAEGFKRSMELYGLKFHKVIGDGDSSVHRRLQIIKPYGRKFNIKKIECRNHLLRNMDKKLRHILEKTNAYHGPDVGKLKTKIRQDLRRFRSAVNAAAKFRREEKILIHEKIKRLKDDILNIPFHIFGNHTKCGDYFCTDERKQERDLTKELEKSGILADIMSAMKYLSYFSDSLLENVDNNACEQFNSVINKHVGGKRIFFGSRGNYNVRVEAAVAAYNTKEFLRSTHKVLANGRSPGAVTKKFLARKKAKAEAKSKRKLAFDEKGTEQPKKKKRKFETRGPDKNYGNAEDIQLLDAEVTEEVLNEKMQEVLDELYGLTEEDMKKLEQNTEDQSESALWHEERKKRLTASNFGKIINMRDSTSVKNNVFSLLYGPELNNAAVQHGKKFEETARKKFELDYHKSVKTCGLFIHRDERYLAASPDGIIEEEKALVEIKCPFNAYLIPTHEEALKLGKVTNCVMDENGKLRLKKNTTWFYQVHGQLQVTGMNQCYFIVWAENWIQVDVIMRDDELWREVMLPKLQRFYKHAILPEIACPLYNFRMDKNDIRESPYVVQKKKKGNGEKEDATNEDATAVQKSQQRDILNAKRKTKAKVDMSKLTSNRRKRKALQDVSNLVNPS